MSREILLLVDALAREKNVNRDVVFAALEMALASATKKRFSDDVEVRVAIDRNTGNYESFRRWKVVPDDALEIPAAQITLSEAQGRDPELKLDDYVEEALEPIEFGRIGAQAAKQVILQKIRDAEREQVLSDFLERKEHIVIGSIKRIERGKLAVIKSISRTPTVAKAIMLMGDQLKSGERTIRDLDGALLTVRPDLALCTGCGAPPVVLDAVLLARRASAAGVGSRAPGRRGSGPPPARTRRRCPRAAPPGGVDCPTST